MADDSGSANLHHVLEMRWQMENQFETLESAYDFVALLGETVAEAKRELEGDVQRESASDHSPRLDRYEWPYIASTNSNFT